VSFSGPVHARQIGDQPEAAPGSLTAKRPGDRPAAAGAVSRVEPWESSGLLRSDAAVAERCALIEAEKANYPIT